MLYFIHFKEPDFPEVWNKEFIGYSFREDVDYAYCVKSVTVVDDNYIKGKYYGFIDMIPFVIE